MRLLGLFPFTPTQMQVLFTMPQLFWVPYLVLRVLATCDERRWTVFSEALPIGDYRRAIVIKDFSDIVP